MEHWLIPVSRAAAKISTDDERLTVLHQNLLQASCKINTEHLPSKLALAYKHFKGRPAAITSSASDSQDFMSIAHNQASIRINIPLNLHSTVVTLTQKKGSDEIEVTSYMRGSDDPRGEHLHFFKAFAEIADIPLTDHLIFQTDLKAVFIVKDEDKIELLAKAIYNLNAGTIQGGYKNNFKSLVSVFLKSNNNSPSNKQEKKAISEKIAAHFWLQLEKTGKLPEGFRDQDTAYGILDLLESKNELSKLIDRILDEIDGKDKSDFSEIFPFCVFDREDLSIEMHKKLAWEVLKDQVISIEDIRQEAREELFAKLFRQLPQQAVYYCDDCFDLFAKLMDEKLGKNKVLLTSEAKLLAELVKGKNPHENWKSVLGVIINDPARKKVFDESEREKLQAICDSESV